MTTQADVLDYDIVWTGTLEMERVKAERAVLASGSWRVQHQASTPLELVLSYIEIHPGVTLQRLVDETNLTRPAVRAAIRVLRDRKAITQERKFGALTWRVAA